MNQMYGFDGEVKAKYTSQMAELFTEVYNWLPLTHCLNKKVLVSCLNFIFSNINCVMKTNNWFGIVMSISIILKLNVQLKTISVWY